MNGFLRGKDVVLASNSPRRRELMALLCEDFRVVPSDVREEIPPEASEKFTDRPFETAVYLAKLKAMDVAKHCEKAVVIGCDTVVAVDGEILGKPSDAYDARRMLELLSGKKHRVISGVCVVYGGAVKSFGCETLVTFRELSDGEIEDYIASGEPFDKAGAYGIQGLGCLLSTGIEGDFYNVVGFPVSEINLRLNEFFHEK